MDYESTRPNPRGETWLNSSDNFGRRMLEKQGWTDGKGLGAKEQGMRECIRVKQKQNRHGFGRNIAEESATALRQCHDSFADILSNLQTLHAGDGVQNEDQPERRTGASEDGEDVVETASEGEEKRRAKRERKEKKKRRREKQTDTAGDNSDCKKDSVAIPSRTEGTIGRSASAMSLYEVASRRKLIHYARYTRSKDVARLTGEDFRGVFGKSIGGEASRTGPIEPLPVAAPAVKSDDSKSTESGTVEPVGSATPLFKSEKTVAEYFAEKKRLKTMQAMGQ